MPEVVGIPPAVNEETEAYWAGAQEGRLLVEQCTRCHAYCFPPRGVCRQCRHREMDTVEITSRGVVYSYTVNHQKWLPDLEVPYAIVLVEFPDAPGFRVVGRVRGRSPEDVAIGMSVEVGFEPGPGGQAVPSFVAVESAA
jgi:uncharacterized protein